MKQLTCELCGSTDLVKNDGVFVCQSCGTKYSVEEAKKMMIEGVVTVEGSVKIDNKRAEENTTKLLYIQIESLKKSLYYKIAKELSENIKSIAQQLLLIDSENPFAKFIYSFFSSTKSSYFGGLTHYTLEINLDEEALEFSKINNTYVETIITLYTYIRLTKILIKANIPNVTINEYVNKNELSKIRSLTSKESFCNILDDLIKNEFLFNKYGNFEIKYGLFLNTSFAKKLNNFLEKYQDILQYEDRYEGYTSMSGYYVRKISRPYKPK